MKDKSVDSSLSPSQLFQLTSCVLIRPGHLVIVVIINIINVINITGLTTIILIIVIVIMFLIMLMLELSHLLSAPPLLCPVHLVLSPVSCSGVCG